MVAIKLYDVFLSDACSLTHVVVFGLVPLEFHGLALAKHFDFRPLWVSEMNLWVTKVRFLHALALSAQLFPSLLPSFHLSLSLSLIYTFIPPHPSGFPICTTAPVNRRSLDRFTAAVPPLAASMTELI